jgi:EthD domain
VFAALGNGDSEVVELARSIGGTAFVANDPRREPAFTTLVIAEDREALHRVADVGLYQVSVRPMRHQRRFWPHGDATPGVTAAFGLLRRPDLTHEQSDAHWRDVHAPLALRHHPGMWHYHQVSIDEVLDGRFYDGVALCAFASEQELSERFFGGPDDQQIIRDDVATFADTVNSPRRVRMTEWRFGEE